jgi:hypothetical protein
MSNYIAESESNLFNSSSNGGETSFDVNTFRAYLRQLLPLVLGAITSDLPTLFDSNEFQENAIKWANDSNSGVVYIVKSRALVDEVEGAFHLIASRSNEGRRLMFTHN